MFYVYSEYIKTGKQNFCKMFDTVQDAIEHIRRCYNIDKELMQLGEYYYFMKKH